MMFNDKLYFTCKLGQHENSCSQRKKAQRAFCNGDHRIVRSFGSGVRLGIGDSGSDCGAGLPSHGH